MILNINIYNIKKNNDYIMNIIKFSEFKINEDLSDSTVMDAAKKIDELSTIDSIDSIQILKDKLIEINEEIQTIIFHCQF